MTGILLRSQEPIKPSVQKEVQKTVQKEVAPNEVFFCPEESHFYSHCLERLVFNHCSNSETVIEFGSGDGSPVINSLLRAQFHSKIHGYELNLSASSIAQSRIEQCNLGNKYTVHNQSFFDSEKPDASYLIANPPYLPAIDDKICMPLLHGGTDGATITNRLLAQNCPGVMVLVSSYSNPIGTITCGLEEGYNVADFMVTPLPFGYYSSESKVKNRIKELRRNRKAFYSNNIYFLAGVLFRKRSICSVDLSKELIQVMTAL